LENNPQARLDQSLVVISPGDPVKVLHAAQGVKKYNCQHFAAGQVWLRAGPGLMAGSQKVALDILVVQLAETICFTSDRRSERFPLFLSSRWHTLARLIKGFVCFVASKFAFFSLFYTQIVDHQFSIIELTLST
jgi:hypothetical protein